MLEFKGITFENYYPDDAEALFYGLSLEEHINNVSYGCGITFEEMLVLDSLDVLFFAQL